MKPSSSESALAPFAPVGALRAWQARATRDPRSRLTFDALRSAACAEANGNDAMRDGLPAIASAWYRDAAARLVEGAKQSANQGPA
jgi:hypothetical protein